MKRSTDTEKKNPSTDRSEVSGHTRSIRRAAAPSMSDDLQEALEVCTNLYRLQDDIEWSDVKGKWTWACKKWTKKLDEQSRAARTGVNSRARGAQERP